MSSGVAYTLQILGQRYTDPTPATLLMSLESVFAALSGWLILHERLTPKELLGCALVFAAVLLVSCGSAYRMTQAEREALAADVAWSVDNQDMIIDITAIYPFRGPMIHSSREYSIVIHDGVVRLCTRDGKTHALNITLEEAESQLDPQRFMRVNRQFIVSAAAVSKLSTYYLGKMRIHIMSKVISYKWNNFR
jgi:hypothetical protein